MRFVSIIIFVNVTNRYDSVDVIMNVGGVYQMFKEISGRDLFIIEGERKILFGNLLSVMRTFNQVIYQENNTNE